MFEHLIRLSLRFRSLTLACAGLLLIAGTYAWLNLPIDAFPDISPTQAKVILKIPGMTPEEVEQRVVKPIEQELLSIPNKRIVTVLSSTDDLSQVEAALPAGSKVAVTGIASLRALLQKDE